MSHDIETRYWLAYGTGWLVNPHVWWMEQVKVSPEREGMERAAVRVEGEATTAVVRSQSTGRTG